MKIFRELYFRGTPNDLTKFAEEICNYASGDWKFTTNNNYDKKIKYLFFDYVGNRVENARVSIYLGEKINTGEINVGNVIPLKKNQLSIEEYNEMLFYNDIVVPYEKDNNYISISQPTTDIFDPLTIMSKTSLKKLKAFCGGANKSTGSSHPCDKERWLNFIMQTVDEDLILDSDTLCRFLQDEEYWGKKPNDFLGAMGDYAWDEESAYELSMEYETISEAMKYYKENRRS